MRMKDEEILERLEKEMHTEYRINKERELRAKKEYNMSDYAVFMKKIDEQYLIQEGTKSRVEELQKEVNKLITIVKEQSELIKILIDNLEITDLPDKIKF